MRIKTLIKRGGSIIKPVADWAKSRPTRASVLALLILGFASRFWLFGYPNQAVFDEVYFGKFANAYYLHSYFFDIHPPLGKLLIAGFVWFFQFNPTQSFATIGTTYTDNGYLFLRFLPGLASAILPVIFYLIGKQLKLKQRTALLIGLAVLLENSLITQGRFILIDSFLILFGFASLWAWLVWRNTRSRQWLIYTGLLAGASMSVKWTGIVFLMLYLVVEFLAKAPVRGRLKRVGALLAMSLFIYASSFLIQFALLTKTGEGDAFMTPGFQKTLEGSQYQSDANIRAITIPEKFIELNYQMYDSNRRLTADHPYGSSWYTWPIMQRPIAYWVMGDNQIWLFGNPIIWWGSSIGVLALVVEMIRRTIKKPQEFGGRLVLAGFLASWLPFATISRVMFLYHYFIPLGFAILCTAYLIDRMSARSQFTSTIVMLFGFLLIFPFTYGTTSNILFTWLRTIIPTWR
ncbi:phospholipid carrier-dependent glycosyltransferase [bacterium]|nr:phospholipid carrier-dependent glycosyltransferase [bacterium]